MWRRAARARTGSQRRVTRMVCGRRECRVCRVCRGPAVPARGVARIGGVRRARCRGRARARAGWPHANSWRTPCAPTPHAMAVRAPCVDRCHTAPACGPPRSLTRKTTLGDSQRRSGAHDPARTARCAFCHVRWCLVMRQRVASIRGRARASTTERRHDAPDIGQCLTRRATLGHPRVARPPDHAILRALRAAEC